MGSIQQFIIGFIDVISNILLPLLFALALLFFVWNAFRFFILGSHEQDARDNAKRLAIYGIAAFVLLVSIWGIVNLLLSSLGLGANDPLTPDYIDRADIDWWYNDSSGL